MNTKQEENRETAFSLLEGNQLAQLKPDNSKIQRRCCICIAAFIIVLCLLGISTYVSFAESTKALRCKVSDTLNLDFVECAPAAILESLSTGSNKSLHHINTVTEVAVDQAMESNASICGNRTIKDGRIPECAGVETADTREAELRAIGERTYDVAHEIMHDVDGWHHLKGSSLTTGRTYSKTYHGIGPVSKLEVHFEATPEQIKLIMMDEIEKMPSWHSAVTQAKIVERIADDICIMYYVIGERLGGLISARDFVNLRYVKTVDNVTTVVETAITHPDVPPTDNIVRAFQRPFVFIFERAQNKPDKVLFRSCAHIDIGMWIPQFMMDRAKAESVMLFVKNMNIKIKQLKKQ